MAAAAEYGALVVRTALSWWTPHSGLWGAINAPHRTARYNAHGTARYKAHGTERYNGGHTHLAKHVLLG
eukprot:3409351-Rhodomonas_salina.1